MGCNVIDHQLNSRTLIMGPFNRFLYWNMDYYLEHHMFPMVLYHKLPQLNELIKNDRPAPTQGVIAAYHEMWPVLKKQLLNEEAFIKRELPATARPHRDDFDVSAHGAAVPAECSYCFFDYCTGVAKRVQACVNLKAHPVKVEAGRVWIDVA